MEYIYRKRYAVSLQKNQVTQSSMEYCMYIFNIVRVYHAWCMVTTVELHHHLHGFLNLSV